MFSMAMPILASEVIQYLAGSTVVSTIFSNCGSFVSSSSGSDIEAWTILKILSFTNVIFKIFCPSGPIISTSLLVFRKQPRFNSMSGLY